MCKVDDLQERRKVANDVSPVEGIASHYHFRFVSEGKLMMRWLACPCDNCFDKDWDGFVNTPFYGDWISREQRELQRKGVSAHHLTRLQQANSLADKVKDGCNVAIFGAAIQYGPPCMCQILLRSWGNADIGLHVPALGNDSSKRAFFAIPLKN